MRNHGDNSPSTETRRRFRNSSRANQVSPAPSWHSGSPVLHLPTSWQQSKPEATMQAMQGRIVIAVSWITFFVIMMPAGYRRRRRHGNTPRLFSNTTKIHLNPPTTCLHLRRRRPQRRHGAIVYISVAIRHTPLSSRFHPFSSSHPGVLCRSR